MSRRSLKSSLLRKVEEGKGSNKKKEAHGLEELKENAYGFLLAL